MQGVVDMENKEARVDIKGQSDSYDRVLEKITELNNRLASEVSKVRSELESLNSVYEELAVNAGRYANSLNDVRNVNQGVNNQVGTNGFGLNSLGQVFNTKNTFPFDEVVNNKSSFNFVSGGNGAGRGGLLGRIVTGKQIGRAHV